MSEVQADVTIERKQALRMLEKLRQGTDCLEGSSFFSTGRELVFQAATDLLADLEVSDGAMVRWVRGRTGQGKTHLFGRLIEIAHSRNWVTSYVQVSDRGYGTELHRFEEIYAAIVKNILCTELVNAEKGHVAPGRISGWDWLLDSWYAALRKQVVGREGGEVPTLRMREAAEQTVIGLRRRWSIHQAFAEALRQFAFAVTDGDEEWAQAMRSWFRGEDVHSGELKARLRAAGIRESLNRRNAKDMLRSLSVFLRYRGFAGTMILLDELENVLHQAPVARRTAYTLLRELIDNIDDRHGMRNAAFYISATPDVFDSPKGISEYEALAERVLLPGARSSANPAGTVLDLAAFPFQRDELLEMADRISLIHAVARQWQPGKSTKRRLETLLDETLELDPDLTARSWVKLVIDELDAGRSPAR